MNNQSFKSEYRGAPGQPEERAEPLRLEDKLALIAAITENQKKYEEPRSPAAIIKGLVNRNLSEPAARLAFDHDAQMLIDQLFAAGGSSVFKSEITAIVDLIKREFSYKPDASLAFFQNYIERVKQLTAADVEAMAREILPPQYSIESDVLLAERKTFVDLFKKYITDPQAAAEEMRFFYSKIGDHYLSRKWEWLIQHTAKHLTPPHSIPAEIWRQVPPAQEEQLAKREELLAEVKRALHAADEPERLKIIQKAAVQIGADYLLAHFMDFELSRPAAEQAMEILAAYDSQAVIYHVKNIDWENFSNRAAIARRLVENEPGAALAVLDILRLPPAVIDNVFDQTAANSPWDFIAGWPAGSRGKKFSAAQIQHWQEILLGAFEQSECTSVELLNHIYGLDFSAFPEVQKFASVLKRQAFKELAESLTPVIFGQAKKAAPQPEVIDRKMIGQALKYLQQQGLQYWALDICTIWAVQQELLETDFFLINSSWTTAGAAGKKTVDPDASIVLLDNFPENINIDLAERCLNLFDLPLAYSAPGVVRRFVELAERLPPQAVMNLSPEIISRLKLAKRAKSELYKKIIDQNPVFFAENWQPAGYDAMPKGVRLYLCRRLVEASPDCLAKYYKKFRLRDPRQEQLFFQRLIDEQVAPFVKFKKAGSLVPFLINDNFNYLFKEQDPTAAIDKLYRARAAISGRAWRQLMKLPAFDYRTSDLFGAMQVKHFQNFDELLHRDGALGDFFRKERFGAFELGYLLSLEPADYGRLDEFLAAIAEWEREQTKKLRRQFDVIKSRAKWQRMKQSPHDYEKLRAAKLQQRFILSAEDKLRMMIAAKSLGLPVQETYDFIREIKSGGIIYDILAAPSVEKKIRFLKKHGPEIHQFLEEKVVGGNYYAVFNIIMKADSCAEKFYFLRKWADEFDSPLPVWRSIAKLSKMILLEDRLENVQSKLRDLVLPISAESSLWQGIPVTEKQTLLAMLPEVNHEYELPLKNLTPSQLETFISNRLQSSLDLRPDQILAASRRNAELAEQFRDQELELPAGALMHYSSQQSAAGVLESGNLCGECLGLSSRDDAYPFFVDSIRVAPELTDRTIQSLLADSRTNYGPPIMYFYPFRDANEAFHAREEISAPDSSHYSHYLFFGGLPKTELGGIVLAKPEQESEIPQIVEKLKAAIIKNDIYVPIFSPQGRLLFTPEEFEKLWQAAKPYDSLAHLIGSERYYENLDVEQGGGHQYTLKEHSIRVHAAVRRLIEKLDLSESMDLIIQTAARLHDIGKLTRSEKSVQEVANTEAARDILEQVKYLDVETKRKILKFVRNDELLGEILKHVSLGAGNQPELAASARKKWNRFQEIFADPQERAAMIALFRADVASIGGSEYEDWQIDEKLAGMIR